MMEEEKQTCSRSSNTELLTEPSNEFHLKPSRKTVNNPVNPNRPRSKSISGISDVEVTVTNIIDC